MNANHGLQDQDSEVNTSIVLSNNADLKKYHASYSTEKERVANVLSFFGANEILQSGDVVLVDIADTWSVDKGATLFTPLKMEESVLHETESQALHGGDSRCHFYHIQDDHQTKLKSLSITVVFTGMFDGPAYVPGELAVELRCPSRDGAPPVLLGSARSTNTASSIGRVLLRHEGVIDGALYEVSVMAGAGHVNYSLALGGAFAGPAATEVRRDMARLIACDNERIECQQRADATAKKLELLERKEAVQERLLEEAGKDCGRIEAELEALDLQMDGQDDMTEPEKQAVVQHIRNLQLEQVDARRLFSLRTKFNERLRAELGNLAEEGGRLRAAGEALQGENEDRAGWTSVAAARLWGDRTAALVMRGLRQEAGETPPVASGTNDRSKTLAAPGVVRFHRGRMHTTK